MQRHQWNLFLLLVAVFWPDCRVAADDPKAELVSVKMIWSEAPHNAFTDLVRKDGTFYCVFREGLAHVSADGALRVITSTDGERWEPAALVTSPTADLRDAKITVTPDGKLMLNGAAATETGKNAQGNPTYTWQSYAWFSDNGRDWSTGVSIGDKDYWMWRSVWHKGIAYGIAYGCRSDIEHIRLYTSRDGRHYDTLVKTLYDKGYPDEAAMLFLDDDTFLTLVRRDGRDESSALLGSSRPPYTEWKWEDLKQKADAPQMMELPNGTIIAASRLHGPARTSLSRVDPDAGKLTEFLQLPSGGDTSYPGLVWHDNLLWISYYSSHEGKTNIYLAKVKFN